MKRVYVAGPYTKGDVAQNVKLAIAAGDRLIGLGFAPFIPHLSHFQHMLYGRPYETWLALDFEWLRACDAVLRLAGDSAGADREVALAIELKIPVFNYVHELVKAFGA